MKKQIIKCDECPSREFKIVRRNKNAITAICLKCGRRHLIQQLDNNLIFIPYMIAVGFD